MSTACRSMLPSQIKMRFLIACSLCSCSSQFSSSVFCVLGGPSKLSLTSLQNKAINPERSNVTPGLVCSRYANVEDWATRSKQRDLAKSFVATGTYQSRTLECHARIGMQSLCQRRRLG